MSIWDSIEAGERYLPPSSWQEAVHHTNEAERLIGISDWWAERGVAVRFGPEGLGVVMLRDTTRESWVY